MQNLKSVIHKVVLASAAHVRTCNPLSRGQFPETHNCYVVWVTYQILSTIFVAIKEHCKDLEERKSKNMLLEMQNFSKPTLLLLSMRHYMMSRFRQVDVINT